MNTELLFLVTTVLPKEGLEVTLLTGAGLTASSLYGAVVGKHGNENDKLLCPSIAAERWLGLLSSSLFPFLYVH